MQYIVNAQEMKECDARTIEYYGVPSLVLMERAALACAEELLQGSYDLSRVTIVCGMGNNGGDGLALARLLYQKQISVQIILTGDQVKASEQTKRQLSIVQNYQIPFSQADLSAGTEWKRALEQSTLLVDALFGVGLSREITGIYAELIHMMNKCSAPVFALDIPSGIEAGSGQVLGCAVQALTTVTFAFCKSGLVLYPGADYAGTVIVRDIGITKESFEEQTPYLYTCSTKEIKNWLPKRPAYSNKGTFGKTVLICGCKGMAGAAYLSAMSAYRVGCGLVRLITPEDNREILQTLLPEAVLTTYSPEAVANLDQDELNQLSKALQWGTVVGIGSGLGTSQAAKQLLELAVTSTNVPIVLDGDGLNILAVKKELFQTLAKRPSAITPHLAEMSRLTGRPIKEIQQNLVETAADFTKKHGVCCVLKDARTVVTSPLMNEADDALYGPGHAYLNLTGNHGMAAGGSGDILAGMICGLAAQGMDLAQAAIAGVHLHGCAGDSAAAAAGARSMTARDILDHISTVLKGV